MYFSLLCIPLVIITYEKLFHFKALRVSLEEQRQRQMQEANAELAGADSIRQQADVNGIFAKYIYLKS